MMPHVEARQQEFGSALKGWRPDPEKMRQADAQWAELRKEHPDIPSGPFVLDKEQTFMGMQCGNFKMDIIWTICEQPVKNGRRFAIIGDPHLEFTKPEGCIMELQSEHWAAVFRPGPIYVKVPEWPQSQPYYTTLLIEGTGQAGDVLLMDIVAGVKDVLPQLLFSAQKNRQEEWPLEDGAVFDGLIKAHRRDDRYILMFRDMEIEEYVSRPSKALKRQLTDDYNISRSAKAICKEMSQK